MKRNIVIAPSFAAALFLSAASAFADEAAGDAEAGRLAFNNACRTCHSVKEGDNRLGPNLHGVIGREAGSEDYAYSATLAGWARVWDAGTLDRFIADPEAVIPGNKMKPYTGISDAATRADIVAYLSEAGSEPAGGEAEDGE
ncbi:MAG TPA: c-type cytochrome [Gammaproteobacteria bacterium]|nr:c-type cytochrome [Gammaproteobacteria bacterium]